MAAAAQKIAAPQLTVEYDRPVDVLHFTLGEPTPYEGDGRAGGVELDFALSDDLPSGAKVIGFHRNGWPARKGELARIISEHLGTPVSVVLDAIFSATR